MSDVDLKSLPGLSQFEMKDHVAVITGGSKGLGAARFAHGRGRYALHGPGGAARPFCISVKTVP